MLRTRLFTYDNTLNGPVKAVVSILSMEDLVDRTTIDFYIYAGSISSTSLQVSYRDGSIPHVSSVTKTLIVNVFAYSIN